MRKTRRAWFCTLMVAASVAAGRAPAAAAAPAGCSRGLPGDVRALRQDSGYIVVDRQGRSLYRLDPIESKDRIGNALGYCTGACATSFSPFMAASDAADVGDWKPVKTGDGRQWTVSDGAVFRYIPDDAPGRTGGQGYDDIFEVVRYVPPSPVLHAPDAVHQRYVAGDWYLADGRGRLIVALSTPPKFARPTDGSHGPDPLPAGLVAVRFGDWRPAVSGSIRQWHYLDRALYTVDDGAAVSAVRGAQAIRVGQGPACDRITLGFVPWAALAPKLGHDTHG